jgi:HNH endonuclease
MKKGPIPRQESERFWEKVVKLDGEDSCWEWTAALLTSGGYGVINIKGVAVRAHRWSYEESFGEIPKGMMVCHHCDNPKCVRPDHLFLGTAEDNNLDMWEKGRKGVFTPEKVQRLRALYEKYKPRQKRAKMGELTHKRIADWFGVSKATISHLLTGRNWFRA